MLVVCKAQETRVRITRQMDLWYRGLHAGLLGDDEAEGTAREDRDAREGRAASDGGG